AHRWDNAGARARVRLCAPTRILVGGDGPRLFLWIRRHDGETNAERSSVICEQVHHRQAARHGCAALARDATSAQADAVIAARFGNSSMSARILLVLVAFTALAGSPTPVVAQSDTATTTFDVNGLKVILRRNSANDVVAANIY